MEKKIKNYLGFASKLDYDTETAQAEVVEALPGNDAELENPPMVVKSLDSTLGFRDKYDVLQTIGSGGQGQVFKVRSREDGQLYATKRISLDSWEEVEKLERDAKVLRHLDSEHIPRFKEYMHGEDPTFHNPEFFLVTELIEGRSLAERIEAGEQFNEQRIDSIRVQTLEALTVAHTQDIVHRDINPRNILVTDSGKVYVTDFGLAKFLKEKSGSHSVGKGTYAYQAPELVGTIDPIITPATDVYILGLTLSSLAMKKLRTNDIRFEDPLEDVKKMTQYTPQFRQRLELLLSTEPKERARGLEENVAMEVGMKSTATTYNERESVNWESCGAIFGSFVGIFGVIVYEKASNFHITSSITAWTQGISAVVGAIVGGLLAKYLNYRDQQKAEAERHSVQIISGTMGDENGITGHLPLYLPNKSISNVIEKIHDQIMDDKSYINKIEYNRLLELKKLINKYSNFK